jgi:hypothetical protein
MFVVVSMLFSSALREVAHYAHRYSKRANEAVTKRKQRKKKRIQKHGTLTRGEREDILA